MISTGIDLKEIFLRAALSPGGGGVLGGRFPVFPDFIITSKYPPGRFVSRAVGGTPTSEPRFPAADIGGGPPPPAPPLSGSTIAPFQQFPVSPRQANPAAKQMEGTGP